MSLTPFDLLLLILAVLYCAEVIARKDGPFKVFPWIRTRLPLGGLTSCSWCLWPWLALVFLVINWRIPPVVYVFAIAGGAAALRSFTGVGHD